MERFPGAEIPKRIYVKDGETYTQGRIRYLMRLQHHRDAMVINHVYCWRRMRRENNWHSLAAFYGLNASEIEF